MVLSDVGAGARRLSFSRWKSVLILNHWCSMRALRTTCEKDNRRTGIQSFPYGSCIRVLARQLLHRISIDRVVGLGLGFLLVLIRPFQLVCVSIRWLWIHWTTYKCCGGVSGGFLMSVELVWRILWLSSVFCARLIKQQVETGENAAGLPHYTER